MTAGRDSAGMEWEPGARGTVIGDRYRVAGELRRRGLLEAVDLDAPATAAACRVAGVAGTAEEVDAWRSAWEAAQDAAGLPLLRDVVADDEDGAWAVLAPARADAAAPLPTDARLQLETIGAALARAGLDVAGVTGAMLVVDAAGRLLIEGVVSLGPKTHPDAAGRLLAALLPPDPTIDEEDEMHDSDERKPRQRRERGGTRRLLLPIAAGVVLLGTVVVLLLPAGSAGTTRTGGLTELAPAVVATEPDVLLGSTDLSLQPPAATVTVTEESAPAVVTVTIAEPAAAASAAPSAPVDDVAVLPVAGDDVPSLP